MSKTNGSGPGGSPSKSWPVLHAEAFHGLLGQAVQQIDPHTEADPAGTLVTLLAAFGSAVGLKAHVIADSAPHPPRLNVVLVGDTSRARKGTSWHVASQILSEADVEWYSNRIWTGLSSGEGLIEAVKDGRGEGDRGVDDKRLFVYEPEFASVLAVGGREGNTLSSMLRQAWDDGRLRVMTRRDPLKATGAHISVLGHVTREELVKRLSSLEVANGFANRFLFCLVRRSKLLPSGGRPPGDLLRTLVGRFRAALHEARRITQMHRSSEATELWEELYAKMAKSAASGMVGAITARAEAQVLRLSLTYALVDGSQEIALPHLHAAWAVWRYAEASVEQIFGSEALTGHPVADRLYPALVDAGTGGLSRREMYELLGGGARMVELEAAVSLLERAGLAETVQEGTGGRPKLVTKAVVPTNGHGPRNAEGGR